MGKLWSKLDFTNTFFGVSVKMYTNALKLKFFDIIFWEIYKYIVHLHNSNFVNEQNILIGKLWPKLDFTITFVGVTDKMYTDPLK